MNAASFLELDDIGGGNSIPSPVGRAVSANGSVVVGSGTSSSGVEAFRWTSENGMVGLGDLPGGAYSRRAFDVSTNGSVIVRHSTSAFGEEAFLGTREGGMVGLGDLPGGNYGSTAWGVAGNGEIVVGIAHPSLPGGEAFRWTSETGMVGLGNLTGGNYSSRAFDISTNGKFIVGASETAIGTRPFLWDEVNGMRDLQSVLENDFGLGPALAGWNLLEALAISDDGSAIVGFGRNPNGDFMPWLAQLDSSNQPIPEPTTMLLLGLGLVSLIVYRRKLPQM